MSSNFAQFVERWGYILRYQRKAQLARRVQMIGRRWWDGATGAKSYLHAPAEIAVNDLAARANFSRVLERKLAGRPLAAARKAADMLLEGRFCFLEQEIRLPDPIDWRLSGVPDVAHLWRFHLHYQDYLLDLIAADRSGHIARGDAPPLNNGAPTKYLARAWNLIEQWIDGNRLDDRRELVDAWHPYCISRRLLNWMLLCAAAPPPGKFENKLLASIHSQVRFLEDHLEFDVRGNHLFENAVALAMTGAFLSGMDAERWLRTGCELLRHELTDQILPHGEHFERSPMYHCRVSEIVLDAADSVEAKAPDTAAICRQSATRMTSFLTAILHPNNDIPQFGDSCLGEASARRLPTAAAATIGDYWTFRDGDNFLIFDAGPVGPDHLPAHAHSDLLTFEASLGGQRVFVDSGVYGYADDEMRRYCRSTAAHNVLQIDGRELCDTWSRFRMGYRGWPADFVTSPSPPTPLPRRGEGRQFVAVDAHSADAFAWAAARHDAYRRIGVPRTWRWIACRAGGPWICVDLADGAGRHAVVNRLHLHPDVRAEIFAENEVRIIVGESEYRLCFATPGNLEISDAWYCPQFGVRERSQVIFWTHTGSLPILCAWWLAWPGSKGMATVEQSASSWDMVWRDGDTMCRISLPFGNT